jgi:hypothetical protein
MLNIPINYQVGNFNSALSLGKKITKPLTDYFFTLTSVFHTDQLEQARESATIDTQDFTH